MAEHDYFEHSGDEHRLPRVVVSNVPPVDTSLTTMTSARGEQRKRRSLPESGLERNLVCSLE